MNLTAGGVILWQGPERSIWLTFNGLKHHLREPQRFKSRNILDTLYIYIYVCVYQSIPPIFHYINCITWCIKHQSPIHSSWKNPSFPTGSRVISCPLKGLPSAWWAFHGPSRAWWPSQQLDPSRWGWRPKDLSVSAAASSVFLRPPGKRRNVAKDEAPWIHGAQVSRKWDVLFANGRLKLEKYNINIISIRTYRYYRF